jgi:hypothetical protein
VPAKPAWNVVSYSRLHGWYAKTNVVNAGYSPGSIHALAEVYTESGSDLMRSVVRCFFGLLQRPYQHHPPSPIVAIILLIALPLEPPLPPPLPPHTHTPNANVQCGAAPSRGSRHSAGGRNGGLALPRRRQRPSKEEARKLSSTQCRQGTSIYGALCPGWIQCEKIFSS